MPRRRYEYTAADRKLMRRMAWITVGALVWIAAMWAILLLR
ncbi:hypothetical protein [Micromonospora sp. DT229]